MAATERERENVCVIVRACENVCMLECVHVRVYVCVRLREREREREKGAVAESQMRWNYVIDAAALTSSVLCDFFGFAVSDVAREKGWTLLNAYASQPLPKVL